MTVRNVIWDMGGTLIDTYPSVSTALAETIRGHGGEIDPAEVEHQARATSIAATVGVLAERFGLAPQLLSDAVARLSERWGEVPPAIMPGAERIINRVRAIGGKNIVVTHRARDSAELLLAATGLRIDGLICAPDGHARKPDPSMHRLALHEYGLEADETIAVGDRAIDAGAALAAGIRPFHYGDVTDGLDAIDTDVPVVTDLAELEAELDRDSVRARMLAGRGYFGDDPMLVAERHRARRLTRRLDDLDPADADGAREVLRQLLGGVGEGVEIVPPLRVDYGANVRLGRGTYFNFGAVLLDVAPIELGERVLLGPGVQLLTAGHPLDAATRATGLEWGRPITIGDDVWLGGGAIVVGGVTIGAGTVVGAGSVVTRDLPAGVIAAGVPARVIREAPTVPQPAPMPDSPGPE